MFQTPRIPAAALLGIATLCAAAACKREPTQAELHLAKGNDLFRTQDYGGCASEIEQSLGLDPQQPQAIWDKCSFCYMKANKLDKAGDTLVKAAQVTVKAEDKLANFRNAAGMYMQGNLSAQAEKAFMEAVKVDPKDKDSLEWLAEMASQRGGARRNDGVIQMEDLEAALGRYDELTTLFPAAPGNYVNKRIVLGRIIGALIGKQKYAPEKDKEAQAKLAARIDELKAKLEETNKKMSEALKAAKALK